MKGTINYIKSGIKTNIFLSFALSLVFLSCGGSGNENRVDTNAVLSDLAYKVILDDYQQLLDRGQDLESAIGTLSGDITPGNVEKARDAWKAAREPWESSEGFLYGPVDTEGIDPSIDSWPVDTSGIQAIIGSPDDIDTQYAAQLDGTLKGYHTMEYLLFTIGGDFVTAEETADYLASDPRLVEYLHAIIVDFNAQVGKLIVFWSPGESDYAGELATAGQGSNVYPTLKAGLEEVVNGILGIAHEVGNEKLNVPFSEQAPVFVESRFSSNSITDFTNNILSIDKIYFGRNGSLSLSDIVGGIDAPVNDDVRQAIDEAVAAINDIPEPFNESVLDPALAPVIQNAIDRVVELRLVLENEVYPIMFPGGNKPPVDET
ncbi:MAG TPA: imelysin family protein [Thermodesulfobacteriota bacterium]|nr:imelysin family protein [Thermodesulfobacteriota bacterium]